MNEKEKELIARFRKQFNGWAGVEKFIIDEIRNAVAERENCTKRAFCETCHVFIDADTGERSET